MRSVLRAHRRAGPVHGRRWPASIWPSAPAGLHPLSERFLADALQLHRRGWLPRDDALECGCTDLISKVLLGEEVVKVSANMCIPSKVIDCITLAGGGFSRHGRAPFQQKQGGRQWRCWRSVAIRRF